MKNFNLFITVFIGLTFSIFIMSCNKDNPTQIGESNPTDETSFTRESFFPTTENGTLKFDTESQFLQFLDYLDTNLPNDSMLITNLQSGLGYLSSLNSQDSDYTYFDKSYSTILNDKFEYIIGNKLYVQKNYDEVYRIDKTNVSSRQILNGLSLAAKLNFDSDTRNVEVLGTDRMVYVGDPGSEECGCSMELRYIDSRTVSVKLHCAGLNFGQNIVMNWGDGTSSSKTYNGVANSLSFTHTYPMINGSIEGNYNIFYSGVFNCGSGNVTLNYNRQIRLSTNCCRKAFDVSGFKRVGNLQLDWRYSVYNNFLGRRVLVNAQSYKYSGSKKLRYNSELEVTMDVNYRSSTCFIGETDHDDNQCTNCKEVQERTGAGAAQDFNKNGDMYFTYYMKADGVIIAHNESPAFCN